MARREFFYYIHDSAAAFRFCLHGDLSADTAGELAQARRTACSILGKRRLAVDVTALSGIDREGRELLEAWRAEGVRLVAAGGESRARAEHLTGGPVELTGNHAKPSVYSSVAAAIAVIFASAACVFLC